MRIVILHETPGADGPAAEFKQAAQAFNRALDIRLRFLDVGFELRTVSVPHDGEPPAMELEETLRRFQPSVVLLFGAGAGLLECAALAAKFRSPLAYLLDGSPDRTSTALACLASILFVTGEEIDPPRLPDAILDLPSPDDPPGDGLGAQLVELLVRTVRVRAGISSQDRER